MAHPLPLSVQANLPRIFGHNAYAKVRELREAPIVFLEALALAAFVPVLWHLDKGSMRLIALRSIGAGPPPTAEVTLPLILRAFPIRNRDEEDWEEFVPCLDAAPADQPTNIGSPIFGSDGHFTIGAKHRIRSLILYARNIAETGELTQALMELDMLVAWDLKERVSNIATIPDGLFVAKEPSAIKNMQKFLALYRQKGANLLAAHRLSMYKTSSLLPRRRTGQAGIASGG